MASPYETRSPITDPETIRQWRTYERLARAAADQYERFPSVANHFSADLPSLACLKCTKSTRARDGVCRECMREAS